MRITNKKIADNTNVQHSIIIQVVNNNHNLLRNNKHLNHFICTFLIVNQQIITQIQIITKLNIKLLIIVIIQRDNQGKMKMMRAFNLIIFNKKLKMNMIVTYK